MASQKNITLTPEQEAFVRENYSKLTRPEICKKLNITPGKLDGNMNFMNLSSHKTNTRKISRRGVVREGYFDEGEYLKTLEY